MSIQLPFLKTSPSCLVPFIHTSICMMQLHKWCRIIHVIMSKNFIVIFASLKINISISFMCNMLLCVHQSRSFRKIRCQILLICVHGNQRACPLVPKIGWSHQTNCGLFAFERTTKGVQRCRQCGAFNHDKPKSSCRKINPSALEASNTKISIAFMSVPNRLALFMSSIKDMVAGKNNWELWVGTINYIGSEKYFGFWYNYIGSEKCTMVYNAWWVAGCDGTNKKCGSNSNILFFTKNNPSLKM